MIPPVILLTLVENIYKHGNLEEEASPATIKLIVNKESIKFSAQNKKRIANHTVADENVGMGNVRTRLMQAYGEDRFSLVVNSDDSAVFELELCILIDP